MSDLTRLQFVFSGRVQNVGFRATTRDAARAHPLTGWVRNDPEGTVTCQVQGRPAHIDAFLADLRARMARNIRSESLTTLPTDPAESTFDIRR